MSGPGVHVQIVRHVSGALPERETLQRAFAIALERVGGPEVAFHAPKRGRQGLEKRDRGPAAQCAVTVVLVDDAEIARLSGEFRGCAHATDVLSFPLGDPDPESGRWQLGEIVVSCETAEREARRRGIDTRQELLLYAVHGMLHLLGCEDQTEAGREAMVAEQLAVLGIIGHDTRGVRRGF